MGIEERYRRVAQQVAQTAREAGRDPREVRLVAVSKTVGLRVWARRSPRARGTSARTAPTPSRRRQASIPQARWHFIGNVQSRRIPDIVQRATLVHSLYHERHVPRSTRRPGAWARCRTCCWK